MNQGVKTVVYPVKDLAKAKVLFTALLGVEPYADAPYYVGYKVAGQDIGLDPNGHKHGMTPYYQVDDIKQSLQALLAAGATSVQDVTDVGGGKLIAVVKDTDGNIIGLTQ
ncbi:MAG: glyoxalase [Anaerolineae bacterium]|nr:glyoxalase [Anaerolineae bacterium]